MNAVKYENGDITLFLLIVNLDSIIKTICQGNNSLAYLQYDYFLYSVSSHLGQGGNLSESSSRITTCPQFVHSYSPAPGFSPV